MDLMLREWDYQQKRERTKIIELFKQYDDNGDGVLTLEEFEVLIKSLEPGIKRKKVVNLFRQTLEKFEEERDIEDDVLSPEAFCAMVQYNKLGTFGREFFSDYFNAKLMQNFVGTKAIQKRASVVL